VRVGQEVLGDPSRRWLGLPLRLGDHPALDGVPEPVDHVHHPAGDEPEQAGVGGVGMGPARGRLLSPTEPLGHSVQVSVVEDLGETLAEILLAPVLVGHRLVDVRPDRGPGERALVDRAVLMGLDVCEHDLEVLHRVHVVVHQVRGVGQPVTGLRHQHGVDRVQVLAGLAQERVDALPVAPGLPRRRRHGPRGLEPLGQTRVRVSQ
jgi:hypothetical protein